MEIYVRTTCWNCFGTDPMCTECEGTGKINRWISIEDLNWEIEKLNRIPDSTVNNIELGFTQWDAQIPLFPINDFELPPNIR